MTPTTPHPTEREAGSRPTSAAPIPTMITRAALKQQLLSTLPPGEESSFLSDAQSRLHKARTQLQSLREERSKVNREIAVRRRKLQEWKEKVPRTMGSVPGIPDMSRELQRCGESTFRCVARVHILDEKRRRLLFAKAYRKGLGGVEGFEKMWVILQVPDGITIRDGRLWTGVWQVGLYLCLVHVENVSEREGVVDVSGMEIEGDVDKIQQVSVLDMKPYLPYCDAWAMDPKAGSTGDDFRGDDAHGEVDTDRREDMD